MKEALIISLKLALLTTVILMFFSLLISPILAFKRFKGRALILGLLTTPLVIPPTVLGFYLILLFSPESFLGRLITEILGRNLLFSFEGILMASLVYSLPFAVLPVVSAMSEVKKEYIETAYVFGYSKLETYLKMVIPLSLNGIITASILVFAHTLGEFGVVLMVGGNIPGETQTLSIFIYDSVQAMDYETAHKASLILVVVSLIVIFLSSFLEKKNVKFP